MIRSELPNNLTAEQKDIIVSSYENNQKVYVSGSDTEFINKLISLGVKCQAIDIENVIILKPKEG